MMDLDTPLNSLPGVGASYNQKLEVLGLITVKDLLHHYPHRYDDWTKISPLEDLNPGEKTTIQGQITSIRNIVTRRGKKMQIAQISDGQLELQVVWFNQHYLIQTFGSQPMVSLSGKIDYFNRSLSMISPQFEVLRQVYAADEDEAVVNTTHTGKLVAIYPETAGLSSKWLRAKVAYCLERVQIADWLTEELRGKFDELKNLLPLKEALKMIHMPESMNEVDRSRERLAFDELLSMQLETCEIRASWQQDVSSPQLLSDMTQRTKFENLLPFELTTDQSAVISEILDDIAQSTPMNRLVQGDVGSGKTVVAAMAAFVAAVNGYQVALMAPTEILAQQHYQGLQPLLAALGVQVVLQTGSQKYIKKGTDAAFEVIVGTHALLSDIVDFDRLGLVIIDEQHRFGVKQRSHLIEKGTGDHGQPHLLTMTATPIPRTIALTMYGDLDISTIVTMPPGRIPPETHVVPESKRAKAYEWIQSELKKKITVPQIEGMIGQQAFIICPFIEPSETMSSIKSATVEYEKMKTVFADFKLALLHGGMKSDEKREVLDDFRGGRYQVLVTTPVVEVGVDIPQATIMLIEGADRFGLAQLHQLRGRIGRGSTESYCFLFSSEGKETNRLKALSATHSGLELAELDLKMRGPGSLYGIAQHGRLALKLADYTDVGLIQKTYQLAHSLYAQLDSYPSLRKLLKTRTIHEVAPN